MRRSPAIFTTRPIEVKIALKTQCQAGTKTVEVAEAVEAVGEETETDPEMETVDPSKSTTRTRTTDYKCYVGSSRQASDFITATNHHLNTIRRSYKKGKDIADAIENGEELDFSKLMPALKKSTLTDADKMDAEKERINQQFLKQFEIEFQAHHEREIQCVDNKAAAAALLWNQCTNTYEGQGSVPKGL